MRRLGLAALLALVAFAASAQTFRPGFAPGFRPGFQFLSAIPSPVFQTDLTQGSLPAQITFSRPSTATYFDSTGTLQTAAANAPRFDYDPATLQPKGLLIEESRTNIILSSQGAFNSWNKTGVTVVDGVAGSPSGTSDASRITEDASSSGHYVAPANAVGLNTGTTYTMTMYAKAGTGSKRWLQLYPSFAAGGNSGSVFDLQNGTFTTTAGSGSGVGSITYVGNGIYRCRHTFVAQSGATLFFLGLANSAGLALNGSFVGDNSSNIVVYGTMLEAGAFPTSYIPTTTTAVTRSADVASNSIALGNSVTVIAEFDAQNLFNGRVIASNPTTSGAFIALTLTGGSSANFGWYSSGSASLGSYAQGVVGRIASSFDNIGNYSAAYNGAAVIAGTNADYTGGATGSSLGSQGGSANFMNGHFRSLAIYNTRLTNTVLQQKSVVGASF